MNDIADEKKKIYQTCRFCGGEFGTRGIKNHEIKCEKLHARPDTPQELQADPNPPEQSEIKPDNPPQPGLKKLKRLTPQNFQETPTKPHKEAETVTEEITTASGNVMKIIQDVAPPAASPIGGQSLPGAGLFDDLQAQAQTAQAVAKTVNNDGVQHLLHAIATALETGTGKLAGKLPGTQNTTQNQETDEEAFIRKFANGEI